jgi:putative colanic acid biosynthesis UDP-glucose lipid carrier transferase
MTKSGERISRLWFALFFALGMVLLTVIRLGVSVGLRKLRQRGVSMRNVLILGAGSLGKRVAENLAQNAWAGLRVVGYLDDDPSLIGTEIGGLPVLGDLDSVRSRVDPFDSGTETSASYQSTPRIHQVWAALPLTAGGRIRSILSLLDDSTVDIHIVPDIFNFRLMNHSIDEIAGLPVINVSRSRIVGTAWLFKALEDKIIAALALIVFVPLMTLIGIGIKLTSAGPVFYHQERMTWCGRRFKMIKFRTMPISVEKKSGPVWAGPNENRATTIGKFLRKFSLDELPQLINVLRGEMSLVGPRPERPHFVVQFRHQIPEYMLKHVMKAGITGWAQVNGWRGRSSLEHRIEHDLYYIKNWSILFDLKILWYTLVKGIMNKNAY